jgi:hypothetical protein
MAMHLTVAAAEERVRVPPWFGHSAVIAPEFCDQDEAILLTGEVQPPYKVRVSSSTWPPEVLRGTTLQEGRNATSWSRWLFKRKHLYKDDCKAIQNARPFQLTLKAEAGRRDPPGSLTLTNLAIGPVWILYINPEHDDHELPELTEGARSRVRVLSLPKGLDPHSAAQWVTAGKAVDDQDRLFCGQPREFANRLANAPGAPAAIGLILIPRPAQSRPKGSTRLQDLIKANQEQPASKQQDFAQGVRAAFDITTNQTDRGSVAARRRTYEEATHRHLSELKREGNVGKPIEPLEKWFWAAPGQDPETSLRVTGRIW